MAGEEVQPAEGLVATACLVADEPLVVTVTGGESRLTVQPSAAALGEFVVRRFHLGLDETAVDAALEQSTLAGLFGRDGWVRRPAAAMLWSYLLLWSSCAAGTQTRPPSGGCSLSSGGLPVICGCRRTPPTC